MLKMQSLRNTQGDASETTEQGIILGIAIAAAAAGMTLVAAGINGAFGDVSKKLLAVIKP